MKPYFPFVVLCIDFFVGVCRWWATPPMYYLLAGLRVKRMLQRLSCAKSWQPKVTVSSQLNLHPMSTAWAASKLLPKFRGENWCVFITSIHFFTLSVNTTFVSPISLWLTNLSLCWYTGVYRSLLKNVPGSSLERRTSTFRPLYPGIEIWNKHWVFWTSESLYRLSCCMTV